MTYELKGAIIGRPASGKDTQLEEITRHFGILAISSSKLIAASPEGQKLNAEYSAQGRLVPDELMFPIVEKGLKGKGAFLLSGYPRTVPQDALLQASVPLDYILGINCSEETAIRRITSRRVCSNSDCQLPYSLEWTPSLETCRKCQADLVQRPDDSLEKAKERMKQYAKTDELWKDYAKDSTGFMKEPYEMRTMKDGRTLIIINGEKEKRDVRDDAILALKLLRTLSLPSSSVGFKKKD
jgi:adenylate kinase